MNLNKCDGCCKDISMDVDFGGAYYSIDGDSYCNKKCYDKYMEVLTDNVNSGRFSKELENILMVHEGKYEKK